MATQRIHPQIAGCYVYEIRVDGAARYIGKGTKKRAFTHVQIARRLNAKREAGEKVRATPFHNRLAKALRRFAEVDVHIVASGLGEDEAFEMECAVIAERGLENLWNTTTGGEGSDGESVRRRWLNEGYRKRIVAGLKAAWAKPGYAERVTEARLKAYTPEKRAEVAEIAKRVWADPGHRAKIEAVWGDDCKRNEASAKALQAWARDPARRERRFAEPGSKERQAEMMRAKWADPAYRAMQIARRGKQR